MDPVSPSSLSPRPSLALRRLVNGYQVSQAIHVASVLGIADLLANGPCTTEDLATATGTSPHALNRLLQALASAGVFREEEGRRFALTPLGDCLRTDHPESVSGWAAFVGEPYHWQVWGALEYSVRTGENAFQHVHGTDAWTYRNQHPELGAGFDRAMTSTARQQVASILDAFDFGRFPTIVDVGGGNGALLAAILDRNPGMRGILFDQPLVVAGAGPLLERMGVADRCEIIGGSFFDSVPQGGDAYVLKSILHDWDDAHSIAILRTCRRAMPDNAVVLLVEREIGPRNEMPDSKFSDLNMLVGPGGAERSTSEFAALLEASGFRLLGHSASAAGPGVFEGVPV